MCTQQYFFLFYCLFFFFFFKQKTAYEIRLSLVGSEMCIRDSKSACPFFDLQIKRETAPHDVVSEEAPLPGLTKGQLKSLDGQRIFCPYIYIAFRGADSIGTDSHALKDSVRITL